jgi:hypothetical protein
MLITMLHSVAFRCTGKSRRLPFRGDGSYLLLALAKNIAILGSTGSIGCNTLDVIERLGTGFRAVAISGHSRTDKLLEQVRRHRPAAVGITSSGVLADSAEGDIAEMRRLGAQIYRGAQSLIEIVERRCGRARRWRWRIKNRSCWAGRC